MRRWRRIILQIVCAVFVLDLWIALHRHKTFVHNLAANTVSHVEDLPLRARNQKYYIVAQFWTSSDILHDFWKDALIELVETLGRDNVYLSFISSASLDNTNEVIEQWDRDVLATLNIPRTVIIDPATHQDAIDKGPVDEHAKHRDGWIITYDKDMETEELRRVPYLSDFRNRGLEPMLKMYREQGIRYDKILYLNDVKFTTSDILSLIATNNGNYDVACSFDFHLTPGFYDTFALRDSQKAAAVTHFFPFFRSSDSRDAILRGEPAPVTSCWNGVVVSDTTGYYDRENKPGLKFRGIPDDLAQTHLEGSECCLIHADLIARGQANKGLFINPSVRVGYKRDLEKYKTTAYQDVHQGPNGQGWVSLNEYVFGIWHNRWNRWINPYWWETLVINQRVKQWKADGKAKGEDRQEPGDYCIIDEMHILIWNGWKHVQWR